MPQDVFPPRAALPRKGLPAAARRFGVMTKEPSLMTASRRPWPVVLALLVTASLSLRAQEQPPLRQIIDKEVRAAWEAEKITAPELAPDGVFLRRVYLDLLGTVPTYDETKQFLDDKAADK